MPDWTRELIKTFPAHVWRRQRRRNCQTLVDALIGVDWLTTLKPDNDDHVSFSAIVLFDTSGRRDLIRRKLIEEKIYPAVLWSLDAPVVSGIDPKYIDFGARMLSFHCDMRYQEVDLLQTSSVIKRLGE
jgi:dTDP-4-amino-4,6-dideoxygalactose transaminase